MFRLSHEVIATFLLVNTTSLKKVKLNIESLHSAKLKEEKASKSKIKGKGKGGSVKMDLDKVNFLCLYFYAEHLEGVRKFTKVLSLYFYCSIPIINIFQDIYGGSIGEGFDDMDDFM